MNDVDFKKLRKYCKYIPDSYFKIITIKSSGITYLISTSSNNKPIILKKTNKKSKMDILKDFSLSIDTEVNFNTGFNGLINFSLYDDFESYIPRLDCGMIVFDEID